MSKALPFLPIADHVYYRGDPDYRFMVESKPFPWYITEDGAQFTKDGELYLVSIGILPLKDITLNVEQSELRIDSKLFPWAILDGSLHIEATEQSFTVVHLTFIAGDADTDTEIPPA